MPLLSAALAVTLVAQTVNVSVSPHPEQGPWQGWGTSLCWMGKMFGDRDDVADLLFTTKAVTIGDERLPGLGLNIVRYNAGACSWNEVEGRRMIVSKTIQPFRQMEGFWLDPRSAEPDSRGWDWSLDAKQRAMMRKAKTRGANRFELFSNAPMWWMCANDNPSGRAVPGEDNLRRDQYDNFAIYLATIARRAKERWGVAFTTVDPFNEPASDWWGENGKQEGCHFSASSQADFLPRLRRELDRRGLRDLPIAASDETYMTQAIGTWKAFDASTRALVAQVNVHGYEGDGSPRAALRAAVGSKPIWLSEHGEKDGSGLAMAQSLAHDLNVLHPTAWCYWQPLDGGGWGLLDSDVPKATIRRANPKHFVLAQYARHIRPGMTLLATDDPETVAAFDAKRHRLVLVTVQGSGAPDAGGVDRSFDLSGFSIGRGSVARWVTEPKGTARYRRAPDLRLEGGRLNVTLSPDSVQTFEISGLRLP